MIDVTLIRFFTGFILFGLVLVPHTHAHYGDSVTLPPEGEPFLPVTEEHRAAWNRVIEDCLPLNTRTALSVRCITSLGEYFANEPIWTYKYVFVYDWDGWYPFYRDQLSQRRYHGPADFLNTDVPFWRHIFDGQIEQRQELFLRVVNDSKCQELASRQKKGMHVDLAEQCAAREMYKYAAYLSACFDATQRLTGFQETVAEDPKNAEDRGLNLFEMSFRRLDENVSDEELKSAAKRHMEKGYLHASWVASHCSQHGLVLRPGVIVRGATSTTGVTIGPYTSTDEKLPWWGLKGTQKAAVLSRTHEFIMKIAMKSGDDWAIRSGYLGRSIVAEFGEDLMRRYPLLMHRILGDSLLGGGYSVDFTEEERARHRAKAYLILVEEAGEEFARREYDPEKLKKHIQYIEQGGLLKAPLTRAEIEEKSREWLQRRQEDEVLKEVQGELF